MEDENSDPRFMPDICAVDQHRSEVFKTFGVKSKPSFTVALEPGKVADRSRSQDELMLRHKATRYHTEGVIPREESSAVDTFAESDQPKDDVFGLYMPNRLLKKVLAAGHTRKHSGGISGLKQRIQNLIINRIPEKHEIAPSATKQIVESLASRSRLTEATGSRNGPKAFKHSYTKSDSKQELSIPVSHSVSHEKSRGTTSFNRSNLIIQKSQSAERQSADKIIPKRRDISSFLDEYIKSKNIAEKRSKSNLSPSTKKASPNTKRCPGLKASRSELFSIEECRSIQAASEVKKLKDSLIEAMKRIVLLSMEVERLSLSKSHNHIDLANHEVVCLTEPNWTSGSKRQRSPSEAKAVRLQIQLDRKEVELTELVKINSQYREDKTLRQKLNDEYKSTVTEMQSTVELLTKDNKAKAQDISRMKENILVLENMLNNKVEKEKNVSKPLNKELKDAESQILELKQMNQNLLERLRKTVESQTSKDQQVQLLKKEVESLQNSRLETASHYFPSRMSELLDQKIDYWPNQDKEISVGQENRRLICILAEKDLLIENLQSEITLLQSQLQPSRELSMDKTSKDFGETTKQLWGVAKQLTFSKDDKFDVINPILSISHDVNSIKQISDASPRSALQRQDASICIKLTDDLLSTLSKIGQPRPRQQAARGQFAVYASGYQIDEVAEEFEITKEDINEHDLNDVMVRLADKVRKCINAAAGITEKLTTIEDTHREDIKQIERESLEYGYINARWQNHSVATNKLNADLRDRLEACRRELIAEKSRLDQLACEYETKIEIQRKDTDKYRKELKDFEDHWKDKIESVGNVIAMYNELRIKSEALQKENSQLEGITGTIIFSS